MYKYTKALGIVIFFLIIFEIMMCVILIYKDLNGTGICLVGNNCNQVQETKYGSIMGIKLGYIALIAFVALIAIYPLKKSRYFLTAVGLGFLFAIFLILVQIFILNQICTSCMIIDFVMILIFILAFVGRYIHHRRQIIKR